MNFIVNGVETIKRDSNKNISTEVYSYNPKTKRYSKGTFSNDGSKQESLGKCPVCQNDVVECSKGYICTNYKNCKFGIWNSDRFLLALKKKPTKTMVKSILKNGFAKVKGLTSKNGSKFDAILKYTKKDNGYFAWDMEFEKEE